MQDFAGLLSQLVSASDEESRGEILEAIRQEIRVEGRSEDFEAALQQLQRATQSQIERRMIREAEPLVGTLSLCAETFFSDTHWDFLAACLRAQYWLAAEQPQRSVPHAQRALDLSRTVEIPEIWRANLYDVVALIYSRQNTDEAIRFQLMSLAILGREDVAPMVLAHSYGNLGSLYLHQKNLQESIRYQELALAIMEREAPESGSLATTYGNLGLAYRGQEDFDRSIEFLERSRDILARIAPNSPMLAGAYVNLALTHRDLKNNEEAERYLTLAREIMECINPRSMQLARIYAYLSAVHRDNQTTAEAVRYREMADALHASING